MRWFWLFILGLVMLTGALYLLRVREQSATTVAPSPTEPAIETNRPARAPRVAPKETNTLTPEPIPEPAPEPVEIEPQPEPAIEVPKLVVDPEPKPEPEVQDEPIESETTNTIEPVIEPVTEPVIEPETNTPADVPVEAVVQEPAPTPEPEPEPATEPAPSFERLDDGSLKVLSTGTIITGLGTKSDPFVLEWSLLRSVQSGYNPKEGKDDLPDWLDELNAKQVKVVGNTLVPVIATTTRELLVMQNPWDGCCIGIPPSPYDAIEVTLNHDVDFGSSAVGYGTVTGEFYLDPYVVNGWVLGLYIIENAQYRSGEGVAFPDF